MSEKHSVAKRNYWSKISPSERSRMASETAKAKWAGMSVEERKKHSQMMLKAKYSSTSHGSKL